MVKTVGSWGALFTERAILFGLLAKLLQGITGPVTAVLIVGYFDPRTQGYHYTFGSLLALQIFVELGLSTVVTIFAGHEWAKLSLNAKGHITGDRRSLSRLAGLARKARRWYTVASVVFLCVLVPAGLAFLGTAGESGDVSWRAPWIALCVLAAASFVLVPVWAVLSGCGQIAEVNLFRLLDSGLRATVLWISIWAGAGLWSSVAAASVSILLALGFLYARYRPFLADLLGAEDLGDVNWRDEIAPLQWRIAVSWISGYFAFSVFTPVTFYYFGPEAAGQMGMAWAIVSGVSGMAATWIQVRSPALAGMVAEKRFRRLDQTAAEAAIIGFAVCVCGGLMVIGAIELLANYRMDLAGRILPVWPFVLFLIAETLHQLSIVQSTYLRAFKKEPFLAVSVGSGLIIGVGTASLTGIIGVYGPPVSYLLGITFGLATGTVIFLNCRKAWTTPRG